MLAGFLKNNNWLEADVIYSIENSYILICNRAGTTGTKKLSAHIIVGTYPRVFVILQYQLEYPVRIVVGKAVETVRTKKVNGEFVLYRMQNCNQGRKI